MRTPVDEVKVPHREVGANRQLIQMPGKSKDQRMPSRITTILTLCPFRDVIRQKCRVTGEQSVSYVG